ncbi:MAG: hypothetical protein HY423_14470 [Candidatus Lambdaproteobacteria bacterium]|nr:hypothetical protein [Candidatus Lambdaproteobacteria bacterium]
MSRAFALDAYIGLWMFGVLFGVLEAMVVIYLRALLGVQGPELFPLTALLSAQPAHPLRYEVYRELATLLALLPIAYLASGRWGYRGLAYLLVFGVWDLSYYAALKALINWPPSLLTYDVLFLMPTVSVAPVLCPLLVALTLVVGVSAYLLLAATRMPRSPSVLQWLLMALGLVTMSIAFTANSQHLSKGGLPPQFPWWLFLVGYGLAAGGALAFLIEYYQTSKRRFS